MSTVVYDKATRTYPGGDRPAVNELDLDIADGEFLVLVGPSGCGKSTSLRMLAGLEEITSGSISIGERDVTNVAAKDRDIAMVFQNYALYPHMTVAENMGFALKIAGVDKVEREQRVRAAAGMLGIEEYLDRKPKALSGGQRQRVAMGRAIVRNPKVFLMDEPLSNLDAKLRVEVRSQISSLVRRLGVTTVYVTHDQTEALTMGDRIAVMRDGVLQQIGAPRDLYMAPQNLFVAGFIGSPAMNLLPATVVEGGVQFGASIAPVERTSLNGASGSITVGVRPEDVIVGEVAADATTMIVDLVEDLGADGYLHGHIELDGARHNTVARVSGGSTAAIGDQVSFRAKPSRAHVFDTASGERLNAAIPV
jgi:multiple sugar transport system ATP-binding protein